MATIMVVEDNPASRDVVAGALEQRGYHVVLAFDRLEAVILAREASPDLILLNSALPDLDDSASVQIPTLLFGAAARARLDHLLDTVDLVLPRNVVS